MGRAAFFAPETHTSPCSRLPPLMTILYIAEALRSSNARRAGSSALDSSSLCYGELGRGSGAFGGGALLVFGAHSARDGGLAAAFLAAGVVTLLAPILPRRQLM